MEISDRISCCQDEKLLMKWLQALAVNIGVDSAQHFLSNVFLLLKCKYSDESLNRLLQLEQHQDVSDVCFRDNKQSQNEASYTIFQLPKGIFNNIGSYLELKSSLNLSKTSHLYHQLIHSKDYFSTSKKQISCLELRKSKLEIIYKNNCCMSSFAKCVELKLHANIIIDNYNVNNCKNININNSQNLQSMAKSKKTQEND